MKPANIFPAPVQCLIDQLYIAVAVTNQMPDHDLSRE